MKRDRKLGITTLESLIGILLLSPLITVLVMSLHTTIRNYFKVALEHSQNGTFLRLSNLLDGIVSDLDSHRWSILPRVHKDGFITLTDGTPNQIMFSSTHPPLNTSDAITGLRLDIINSQRVTSTLGDSNYVVFTACPRYGKNYRSDLYHNYIGISADGFVELEGTVSRKSSNSPCLDFRLIKTKSMSVLPSQLDRIETIRLIVPILSQYTLYVDKNNELRYLAHEGETNIENQPIGTDLKSLSFTSLDFNTDGIMELKGEVLQQGTKRFNFFYQNALPRTSQFNLLLIRP